MNRLVPPLLLLLVLGAPRAGAESPDPARMLRRMAAGGPPRDAVCRQLADRPFRLLDLIFAPPETDAPDPDKLRVARQWIPLLGAERYPDRVRAEQALREAGPGVRPALKEARTSPSPEIRLRSQALIEGFADHPELAALDYAAVREGVATVAAGIEADALLETLTERACRRLGTPTVHGQERWLMRPFFAELLRRESPRAATILREALASSDLELAGSVAAAAREFAAREGINRSYLAALEVHASAPLERLLAGSPNVDPDDPLAAPFRERLLSITREPSLSERCRLRAHRLLLIHFDRAKSLVAILDAALNGESEVAAAALSDPRLIGIRIEGAERAGELVDHPSAELRKAAALFLATRPGERGPRQALRFLPELAPEAFNALCHDVGNLIDSSGLRRQLEAEVERKGPAAKRAEQLLWALPDDLLQVAPANPFLFR